MCNEEYMGETSRTLGKRNREHLKDFSPIYAHSTQPGHNTMPKNFNIIGTEDHGLARTIKESIYIGVKNPTLNRNIHKYNFHQIYGTESYLTFLTWKLTVPMGMHTEHTLVGMLSPSQPIGMHIEPKGILGMLWIQSIA